MKTRRKSEQRGEACESCPRKPGKRKEEEGGRQLGWVRRERGTAVNDKRPPSYRDGEKTNGDWPERRNWLIRSRLEGYHE